VLPAGAQHQPHGRGQKPGLVDEVPRPRPRGQRDRCEHQLHAGRVRHAAAGPLLDGAPELQLLMREETMLQDEMNRARRPLRRLSSALLLAAAAVSFAECDSLLEVDDPDVLKPDQVADESAIPTRIAGAILDFLIAFNGNSNNALLIAHGLITDEYVHSETF